MTVMAHVDLVQRLGRKLLVAILATSALVLIYVPLFMHKGAVKPVAFVWPQNQSRDAAEFVSPNTPTALLSPSDACPLSNAKQSLLVLVCSATGNDRERNVIRETWAHKALTPDNVKVLFLVGRNLNDSLQATLAKESQIYGDLIQENFIDTYANLTIKSLMLLKWFTTNCQHVPYVMKTDDDMFVNLNRLTELVARNKPGQPTLIGALICGAVPIRDPYNKWYVPEYMYHKKLYPNYLSGTGYLMGNVTAQKLLKASMSNPMFHLEDIYLTGILAAAVDIKPRDDVGFTYVKRPLQPCLYNQIITSHHVSMNEMRIISKKMLLGDFKNCKKLKPSQLRTHNPQKCK